MVLFDNFIRFGFCINILLAGLHIYIFIHVVVVQISGYDNKCNKATIAYKLQFVSVKSARIHLLAYDKPQTTFLIR